MAPPRVPMKDQLGKYSIDKNGCWLFTGNLDRDGYGVFTSGRGKQLRAHRASFSFHKTEIPEGMLVCHHCDVPSCINPDHLFLGTPKCNTQDMIRKNRLAVPKGEMSSNAKLSDQDVLEIRFFRANGELLKHIANKFNIAFQTVSSICRRTTWKHI